MNTVRHDSYRRGAAQRRRDGVSAVHFFLMFIAAGLLVLNRVEHPLVDSLTETGQSLVQPVLGGVSSVVVPLRKRVVYASEYITHGNEVERLKQQLAERQQLVRRSTELARRNRELAGLVNLVKGAPVEAVTAEVIGGPRGLFAKSATLAAGRLHGIRYGQPVFSVKGLFGRIVAVAEKTSRVLILNDINSRIPVEVGKRRYQALLVGDNSDQPMLVYLDKAGRVSVGDAVVTSGVSGEFPRGITVGHVIDAAEPPRVAPLSGLLPGTYLSVLRYELPSMHEQTADRLGVHRHAVAGPGRRRAQ